MNNHGDNKEKDINFVIKTIHNPENIPNLDDAIIKD